jgi:hypothetical protein
MNIMKKLKKLMQINTLVLLFLLILLINPAQVSASTNQTLTPLDWAEKLILNITPDHNAYTSKHTAIRWEGIDGATISANRTVCSSFVTRLLKKAYRFSSADIQAWMGTTNPQAKTYYDTITQGKHFQMISQVNDIHPGDFLAIKYLENAGTMDDGESDSDNSLSTASACPKRSTATGHIVLIREAPAVHKSSPPIQPGLMQYSVKVIDSSRSGHGCQDTRLLPNHSCSDKDAWGNGGAGSGTMRLYADRAGSIAGYSWSLRPQSTYYSQDEYTDTAGCQIPAHLLAVGRLTE